MNSIYASKHGAMQVSGLTLQSIERELRSHRPRRKFLRRLLNRAAVAVILRERGGMVEVLMIRRAECEGDPWSGQMAFPGGRMDPSDRHGFDVAVRETAEEIGLRLDASSPCIGRLSEVRTHFLWGRRALVITPFVFRLDRSVELALNHEVAEVVWVPMPFLMDRDNCQRMTLNRNGVDISLPCYIYQGRRIWGLSLMMLRQLLALLGRGTPIR